jgi:hypothetical protein
MPRHALSTLVPSLTRGSGMRFKPLVNSSLQIMRNSHPLIRVLMSVLDNPNRKSPCLNADCQTDPKQLLDTARFGVSVAPAVGFEPTTNRLTADRSTTELRWITIRNFWRGNFAQLIGNSKPALRSCRLVAGLNPQSRHRGIMSRHERTKPVDR